MKKVAVFRQFFSIYSSETRVRIYELPWQTPWVWQPQGFGPTGGATPHIIAAAFEWATRPVWHA